MKHIKLFACSIILTSFQFIEIKTCFASSDAYIKINVNLNLRSSANFSNPRYILKTLKSADNLKLKVLENHSTYYKVELPDRSEGYIHKGRNKNYTSLVNTTQSTVPDSTAQHSGLDQYFSNEDSNNTDNTGSKPGLNSQRTPIPTPRPPIKPTTNAPSNVQKYCKKGRYFYYERECKRRGVVAKYCKDSRHGYHICGSNPSRNTNVATQEDINNATENTGGRRTGKRGSCGPGIYVASPIKNGKTGNRLFGMYMHPILKRKKMHHGWDYPGRKNNKIIRASASGVVKCSKGGGAGNMVTINHGKGLSTKYMHLSSYTQCNKKVARGSKIGTMGTTGLSTGVHLHYGVYCKGSPVNPAHYVGLSTGANMNMASSDQ